MYAHTVGTPLRPEKSFGCPGIEGIGSTEQPVEGVANLGPLKEQQGPLTTESALQPLLLFPPQRGFYPVLQETLILIVILLSLKCWNYRNVDCIWVDCFGFEDSHSETHSGLGHLVSCLCLLSAGTQVSISTPNWFVYVFLLICINYVEEWVSSCHFHTCK